MNEEELIALFVAMASDVEASVAMRLSEVAHERRERERELAEILLFAVDSLPQRGGVIQPGGGADLEVRMADRVRVALSKTWRRFVGSARSAGSGPGVGGRHSRVVRPVDRHHSSAAAAAKRLLDALGMRVPSRRRVIDASVRDLALNVRKLIEREVGAVAEFLVRVAQGGVSVAAAREAAGMWRFNRGYWDLALGSHVRGTARGVLASSSAERFMVIVPLERINDVRENGLIRRLLFRVLSPAQLDAFFASLNASRGSASFSTWRTLGLHHGSFELYVPVPSTIDVVALVRAAEETWGRR